MQLLCPWQRMQSGLVLLDPLKKIVHESLCLSRTCRREGNVWNVAQLCIPSPTRARGRVRIVAAASLLIASRGELVRRTLRKAPRQSFA